VGYNGITSAIRAATAAPSGRFGTLRVIAPSRTAYLTPPSIAAAGGRVALAWGYTADRTHFGLQAAVGPAARPGPPQTIATATSAGGIFPSTPVIDPTLGPGGRATIVYQEPVDPATTTGPSGRLLAVDGR
jgi:hypothetical protein